MSVIDNITGGGKTAFSFEILPPVKGNGTKELFAAIDTLREFNPKYINITTHRSETVYRDMGGGVFERNSIRRRPGTVAIASAIQNRYKIPVVPHILCSGYSREETEYVLIDLQFLGITDLLLLRGDKATGDVSFSPVQGGWSHTLELSGQVNDFNRGVFLDGSPIKHPLSPFHYGVAGYPEKHEEAPNMERDIHWLKKKVEAGADYIVTQMFFDNRRFMEFAERVRHEGIDVPIVPGIKPFSKVSQLTTLPKTFNVDLPQELVSQAVKCRDDDSARALGVEWCVAQCRELIKFGVPGIHFYTVGAVDSVKKIAEEIY